jgi:hypothetical protein
MADRLPQLAGVVFAALFTAALLIVPPLPGIDKSGEAIVAHMVAHGSALRLQALLVALGSLALVIVLAHARTRLDGAAGYVLTIGSALIITEFAVEMWFTSGLALHAASLNPATARALADVALMWGPLLTVADVMVAVPIALACVQGKFPRWVGALGAIFAVEQLIETVTIVGGPGLIEPGGTMNLYVGGPLFLVFFLALGRRPALDDPAVRTTKQPPQQHLRVHPRRRQRRKDSASGQNLAAAARSNARPCEQIRGPARRPASK